MINQNFKYSCGGCIVLHARVIDVLLCISNGRPERADGRVDRRTGSQTAAWTCSHEGMFTPCCYLHTFGTCSGCLATCMLTSINYLHALGNRRRTEPCGRSGRMDVWKGADRQPDSQTAGWTCTREGMLTPCCYLHVVGTCSGCLATCMFAVEGLLGQPEWADSRAGLTCVQDGMFTACCYLPAFGTCSGCLATCMFTNLNYLHALGNRRRTAKAAGAVGWTCGRAD